jgi:hypothetical protein
MPAGTFTCRVSYAGRWALRRGERRRLSITFEHYDEIEAGDPLVAPPTVTLEAGSGVLVSGETVVSPVVFFVADTLGATPGDWAVEVACLTAAGWRLVRLAVIRVEG